MNLREIFDQLTSGELSQTNLEAIDTDTKIARAVNHVNLGLADLFKRFFLREGSLEIQLLPGQTGYPIEIKYALSNTASVIPVGQRFILDSVGAPFTNDLLKIEKVCTGSGFELSMDDSSNVWALTTTDTKPPTLCVPLDIVNQSLDLPDELKTDLLAVTYRARHPKIDTQTPGFDPDTYEVLLPDSHLQALCYYVASRVLGPAGMGQTEGVTSGGYWKRYEAECIQLKSTGMQLQHKEGFDLLRDRGFV